MRAAVPILIRGIVLWAVTLLLFLAAASLILRIQNPEVSAFLEPAAPGATKSIEARVLDEYKEQRRFLVLVAVASSLAISQIALALSVLRNRSAAC